MRVLVCGGRNFADRAWADEVLDLMHGAGRIARIIHGGARGADQLADEWAVRRGVPVSLFLADWARHGKAAGPLRNQQMLDEGKPDRVVAFPGGRGTADMVARAQRAGVLVYRPGEVLVRVTAPHFCAGLVLIEDVCAEAAPILGWAVGKGRAFLRADFARRGYRAIVVLPPGAKG